ncbi:MAG: Unknown protein [uncultured Sulfurovum sp.]|uniref:Lipoprotein n=1 Tax=uncultured Sulfurovum sp. TaxID=269237 RepID=A0A6S6SQP5_9BACT|nr:MAG: Unknown protein [uncultured Sulfurovum sp.]
MKIQTLLQTVLLSATALVFASCTNKVPTMNVESGELVLYPDPTQIVVHPNEEIAFKFIPESKTINVENLKIEFGESTDSGVSCTDREIVDCRGQTLHALHTYKSPGSYRILIKSGNTVIAEKAIIIPESYISDEELQYDALKQIAQKLKIGIKEVANTKPDSKFAFSSLKDANFEYATDKKDVKVIYKVMQALVESGGAYSNYKILEREPQALVRLAHESLWTEKDNTFDRVEKLEFGLKTVNGGQGKPMVYDIELAGVNDSRVAIDQGSKTSNIGEDKTATITETSSVKSLVANEVDKFKESGSVKKASKSQRPLLFARFDTANFLVVIDRVYDASVKRSPPVYFDKKYNTLAIKRTAKFKINARILDRDGRIHWIKDLSGEKSDLVLPQFAPNIQKAFSVEKEKSIFSFLNPFN